MKCSECFDNHWTSDLLAEFCQVSITRSASPEDRQILTFICPHGGEHRHAVYGSEPPSVKHHRLHVRVSMWASRANIARREQMTARSTL